MGKLATFFRTFVKSFISPKYYAEVVQAKFSFSLKFFLFYFFLYSLVLTAYLIPNALIPLNKMVKQLPDKILEIYPAELTIAIKNGQVSTNVQEPYSIPFPVNLIGLKSLPVNTYFDVNGTRLPINKLPDLNLLTIDTQARVTDIAKYNALFLLTKDSISMVGDQSDIRTYPLGEIKDVTINKLVVFSIVQAFAPYLEYVVPAIGVLVFLAVLIFLPLGNMIGLLFFSILTWIVGKIMRLPLGYGKYYQIGLHITVVWTTILGVMVLARLKFSIPFLGIIFMLLFVLLALYGVKQGLQPPAPAPSPVVPLETPPASSVVKPPEPSTSPVQPPVSSAPQSPPDKPSA